LEERVGRVRRRPDAQRKRQIMKMKTTGEYYEDRQSRKRKLLEVEMDDALKRKEERDPCFADAFAASWPESET
jgi:hypothetical protein